MKKKLKRLLMLPLMTWLILMSVNGCRTAAPLKHLPNPKAVYYAPPEGIDVSDGGILYRDDSGGLLRISGPMQIPGGWRITGPKQ